MLVKIFNLKNIIWFCAIGLATFSGYYSVFGISKLFAGGAWSIVGMAAMLELSKLVVVTFLHDHFKTLRFLFKGYLLSAAVVLMAITSIGVYGYLTNSYQETAKVIYKAQNEIGLLDQKKQLFIEQKTQIDKLVEEKNGRLKSLDNIRVSQQNAYTQQLTQKRGTGGLSRSMSSVDKTTETLNTELSQLTEKSFSLSDSIARIDQTKLTLTNESFSSELGPLLYLSRITGIPMDNVVNWFILILVIVFDPLAVSLVIAANHLSGKEKQKKVLDELSQLGQEMEAPTEEPDFFKQEVSLDADDVEEDVVIIPVVEDTTLGENPISTENVEENVVEEVELEPEQLATKEIPERIDDEIVDLSNSGEIGILDEQNEFYEEIPKKTEKKSENSLIHKPVYTRGISV